MAGVSSSTVVGLKPAAAVPQSASASPKRVQVAPAKDRRAALLGLAAVFAVTAATATGSANASVFDEYLEKSKVNKVCSVSSLSSIDHQFLGKVKDRSFTNLSIFCL